MKKSLLFFGEKKLGSLGVVILLIVCSISSQAQRSKLIGVDTTFMFDKKARVLFATDETPLTKKFIRKTLRSQFDLKRIQCGDGFSRDGLRYLFFHTNVVYPRANDELAIWNLILSITGKLENSRFLGSGWFTHKNRDFYYLNKSIETKNQAKVLAEFTFFELDGTLAIIIYECDRVELLDQLPLQVAFAHHGNDLRVPIFQR